MSYSCSCIFCLISVYILYTHTHTHTDECHCFFFNWNQMSAFLWLHGQPEGAGELSDLNAAVWLLIAAAACSSQLNEPLKYCVYPCACKSAVTNNTLLSHYLVSSINQCQIFQCCTCYKKCVIISMTGQNLVAAILRDAEIMNIMIMGLNKTDNL